MKVNAKSLLEMANPPVASRLVMFEDDALRSQILGDLLLDIALEGLDTTGLDIGPMLCGRYHPEEERLINLTGSGTILSVIYHEQSVGSLYYVPAGWTYKHKFGTVEGMFNLLDLVRGEDGYHFRKYNGDL